MLDKEFHVTAIIVHTWIENKPVSQQFGKKALELALWTP